EDHDEATRSRTDRGGHRVVPGGPAPGVRGQAGLSQRSPVAASVGPIAGRFPGGEATMAIPSPIHDDTPGADVSDVARREFNIARKGYERDEVRWYLRRLAERIASLEAELKNE